MQNKHHFVVPTYLQVTFNAPFLPTGEGSAFGHTVVLEDGALHYENVDFLGANDMAAPTNPQFYRRKVVSLESRQLEAVFAVLGISDFERWESDVTLRRADNERELHQGAAYFQKFFCKLSDGRVYEYKVQGRPAEGFGVLCTLLASYCAFEPYHAPESTVPAVAEAAKRRGLLKLPRVRRGR